MKRSLRMLFSSLFFAVLFLCPLHSFTADSTSRLDLDEENARLLSEGEIVMNVLDKPSELCLVTEDEEFSDYLEEVKKLNAVYLCECIKTVPYKGHENLMDVIDASMLDIPCYLKIPYYSEYNDVHTFLFFEAQELKREEMEEETSLDARFYMPPFDRFTVNLDCRRGDGKALYKCTNTANINYRFFFRAASKKNMKVSLFLFRNGDDWYLYSIGAIKTFRFPFFESRIRMAIVNRLKDFASYFVSLI